MTFSPGDPVHITALGKGIVREVRSGGRYLVDVKGRSMLLDGTRLRAVEERRRSKKRSDATPASLSWENLARADAPASLDLHGMTVPEALAGIEAFVSDAILAGLPGVRIVHGRSGGRLKAAVHARLKALPAVRYFRLDPRNSGVTIVEL